MAANTSFRRRREACTWSTRPASEAPADGVTTQCS